MPNTFLYNKYLCFKECILAYVHSLIVKKYFYFKLFNLVKQFYFKQIALEWI